MAMLIMKECKCNHLTLITHVNCNLQATGTTTIMTIPCFTTIHSQGIPWQLTRIIMIIITGSRVFVFFFFLKFCFVWVITNRLGDLKEFCFEMMNSRVFFFFLVLEVGAWIFGDPCTISSLVSWFVQLQILVFFFLLGFGNMFPSLFWLNNKYYISRDELFHL